MQFIDTHTHLDDHAFDGDREEVLAASRSRGVSRWINVGYNERMWASTVALAEETAGLSYMLGLHPGSTDEWSHDLFGRLRGLVARARPVAIGEIGIDLYWRQDNLDMQHESFTSQLGLAIEHGLPAVIHMRDADAPLLEVLTSSGELPHIHFHSFDGDAPLREWLLANGATIGVGGLVTRAGSGSLREWVVRVPRDRVVLETDAPYLKPRGIRGQRNQPAYLVKVAELLAQLWDTDVEEVAHITTVNATRIFGKMETPTT